MHWYLLAPELALAAGILVVLLLDACCGQRVRGLLHVLALASVAAAAWLAWQARDLIGFAADGMYLADGLATALKLILLGTSAAVLVLARETATPTHPARSAFALLILLATTGMCVLASVGDFLLLFVALELMTFSFYVMTAYLRTDTRSIEAGLKYLVLGAIASGCLLYGTSLIYGATGSTRFAAIATHVTASGVSTLLLAGTVLVLVGLAFKWSAVPFQWWVPDVYQGAPTPVTAFLAAGSKAAGFAVALRLIPTLFLPVLGAHWQPWLAATAAVTMCYGNLVALTQTNVKRLLAYSSIGHAGYLLLGLATLSTTGFSAVVVYLAAYALMTVVAFAVVTCVANATDSDELTAFEGLSQRSPFLAAALFLALLSLAGVPPLLGFFGKFWLLLSAVESGLLWLVAVGVLNVVISLYYYLLIVKRMYLHAPTSAAPVPVSRLLQLTIYAGLAGLLFFGMFQQPLVAFALRATRGL